jgi:sortase A
MQRRGVVIAVALLAAGCAGRPADHSLSTPVTAGAVSAPVLASITPAVATTSIPPPPPAPPAPPAPAPRRAATPRAPLIAMGRLVIPRLGLDTTVYEGETLAVIDHGPGHFPWSAKPGELGNVVIAGHRVTKTRPFRNLHTLQPGDTATFEVPSGTYTYVFVGHDVVTPDRIDITNQDGGYRATMFACHPPGSARYRLVAHWQLRTPPAPTPG